MSGRPIKRTLRVGHLERDEALSLPLDEVLAYVRADPTLWASWCV